jgi:hypothetical protein
MPWHAKGGSQEASQEGRVDGPRDYIGVYSNTRLAAGRLGLPERLLDGALIGLPATSEQGEWVRKVAGPCCLSVFGTELQMSW